MVYTYDIIYRRMLHACITDSIDRECIASGRASSLVDFGPIKNFDVLPFLWYVTMAIKSRCRRVTFRNLFIIYSSQEDAMSRRRLLDESSSSIHHHQAVLYMIWQEIAMTKRSAKDTLSLARRMVYYTFAYICANRLVTHWHTKVQRWNKSFLHTCRCLHIDQRVNNIFFLLGIKNL